MKSLDFIFVGQVKNPAYKKLEEFYLERVSHYVKSTRVDIVKDGASRDILTRKKQETAGILDKITAKDVLVTCDEFGKSLSSRGFAQKLDSWCGMGQRLVFIVGGPYGMTEEIKHRSHYCLKLSDWTLPHELARVVVMEQVYRGFTILKGEKYHH